LIKLEGALNLRVAVEEEKGSEGVFRFEVFNLEVLGNLRGYAKVFYPRPTFEVMAGVSSTVVPV
jgi:hypothetical protein